MYPAIVGAVYCRHSRPYGPLFTHSVVKISDFKYSLYTVGTAPRDGLIQPTCPVRFHPPPLGLTSHGPVTPLPAAYPDRLRARCLQ